MLQRNDINKGNNSNSHYGSYSASSNAQEMNASHSNEGGYLSAEDVHQQYLIALNYYHGTNAYPTSKEKAFELLSKCAMNNHVKAMLELGCMYFLGEHIANPKGEKNFALAMKWWSRPELKNNSEALYGVGMIYHLGNHQIARDTTQAKKYLQMSADLGYINAKEVLEKYYSHNQSKQGLDKTGSDFGSRLTIKPTSKSTNTVNTSICTIDTISSQSTTNGSETTNSLETTINTINITNTTNTTYSLDTTNTTNKNMEKRLESRITPTTNLTLKNDKRSSHIVNQENSQNHQDDLPSCEALSNNESFSKSEAFSPVKISSGEELLNSNDNSNTGQILAQLHKLERHVHTLEIQLTSKSHEYELLRSEYEKVQTQLQKQQDEIMQFRNILSEWNPAKASQHSLSKNEVKPRKERKKGKGVEASKKIKKSNLATIHDEGMSNVHSQVLSTCNSSSLPTITTFVEKIPGGISSASGKIGSVPISEHTIRNIKQNSAKFTLEESYITRNSLNSSSEYFIISQIIKDQREIENLRQDFHRHEQFVKEQFDRIFDLLKRNRIKAHESLHSKENSRLKSNTTQLPLSTTVQGSAVLPPVLEYLSEGSNTYHNSITKNGARSFEPQFGKKGIDPLPSLETLKKKNFSSIEVQKELIEISKSLKNKR